MTEVITEDLALELYERLLRQIVVFEYKKKDGTRRRAIGTLSADLIPPKASDVEQLESMLDAALRIIDGLDGKIYHSDFEKEHDDLRNRIIDFFEDKHKTKDRKQNPNVLVYYDFEAAAFRSCQTNLIKTIYQ